MAERVMAKAITCLFLCEKEPYNMIEFGRAEHAGQLVYKRGQERSTL